MEIKIKTRQPLIKQLLMVFNLEKSCLSANWQIMSFLRAIFAAVIALLVTAFLGRGFHDYLWLNSLLILVFYYLVDFTTSRNYRKKITNDMQKALMIKFEAMDNDGKNGSYHTWVTTLAGTLCFISEKKIAQSIAMKSGAFYDYFEYPEIKDLNRKDLRYFITECSGNKRIK